MKRLSKPQLQLLFGGVSLTLMGVLSCGDISPEYCPGLPAVTEFVGAMPGQRFCVTMNIDSERELGAADVILSVRCRGDDREYTVHESGSLDFCGLGDGSCRKGRIEIESALPESLVPGTTCTLVNIIACDGVQISETHSFEVGDDPEQSNLEGCDDRNALQMVLESRL